MSPTLRGVGGVLRHPRSIGLILTIIGCLTFANTFEDANAGYDAFRSVVYFNAADIDDNIVLVSQSQAFHAILEYAALVVVVVGTLLMVVPTLIDVGHRLRRSPARPPMRPPRASEAASRVPARAGLL